MKLTKSRQHILLALFNGATLKTHRYLDGSKICQLHPLDGPPQTVQRATVDYLKEYGLIDSNKKFPAATYLLTARGREIAARLE